MNCYKCNDPITELNATEEHLLQNSLGGHKTSKRLICSECNEEFGNTIDKELAEQLEMFSAVLIGKRDRKGADKGIEIVSQSGTKKTVGFDFKPKPTLTLQIPGKQDHKITGSNEEYLKKIANKRKKELEQKFGTFELKEGFEDPPKEKFYFMNKNSTKVGEVGFGGLLYYRAIAKIILNFYLVRFPDKPYPTQLREFVCGRTEQQQLFLYYPSTYEVHKIGDNEFSHVLHIRGEKEIGAIYGYIELFNSEKFICIINSEFNDDDFEYSYCHDCRTGKAVDKKILVNLEKHHVEIINLIGKSHYNRREISHNQLLVRIEQLQDLGTKN